MIDTSFSQPQYANPNFKGMTWGSGFKSEFAKGKNFNFENNTIHKDFFSKSNLKDDNLKNNTNKNTIFEKIKPTAKETIKEYAAKLKRQDDAERAQEAADRARRFREAQEEARRSREQAQARARQQAPSQEPKPTPHEVFAQHGITLSASPSEDELKKAYINLARRLHPDKHPPEDREKYTEMMKAVAEAYNELK